MDYNDRMRELRLDHDKTQKEIANILGTSHQYYQKYEKGIRPLPLEHLFKLCLLYNVSADYILGLPKGLRWPR